MDGDVLTAASASLSGRARGDGAAAGRQGRSQPSSPRPSAAAATPTSATARQARKPLSALSAASTCNTSETLLAPLRVTGPCRSPVSTLDLVTALPLLLSLDRSHYTATLNRAQEGIANAVLSTRQTPSLGAATSPSDDAATIAVRAVLHARSTPAWQAQRRRMRRRALDALFRSSHAARIGQRQERGCGDGVRASVAALLQHTRAVLMDVSPTQVHMLDLFTAPILGRSAESGDAAAAEVAQTATQKMQVVEQVAARDQADGNGGGGGSASISTAATSELTKLAVPLRGIMKTTGSVSVSAAASPRFGMHDDAEPSMPGDGTRGESATVAEQLLYIILRTSIAANTPRRPQGGPTAGDDGNEGVGTAASVLATGLCTPPMKRAAGWAVEQPPPRTSSSTTTTSTARSSGLNSLVRKKPRLDGADDAERENEVAGRCDNGQEVAALHRGGVPSITRQYAGAGERVSRLPYEPRCWLAPSMVALVEQSQALRRQQRWTCDLDPVIEATVAGEEGPYSGGGRRSGAALTGGVAASDGAVAAALLGGVRSAWAAAPGLADSEEDAAALAALVHSSGLPFDKVALAADQRVAAPATGAPVRDSDPHAGAHDWGAGVSDGAPDVEALFLHVPPQSCSAQPNATSAATPATSPSPGNAADVAAAAVVPACRIPFVSCQPLYTVAVYAQVHLALHRCTAGLLDPYGLTELECRAGADLPAVRVRAEFYVAVARLRGDARVYDLSRAASTSGSPVPRSGLTALLEWGCRYGTLLLRLRRLCDVADSAALRGTLGSYGRCAMRTLRVLLSLLQRQLGELGERHGGPHRLGFDELLTAHQRLQRAVEEVEVLADFFFVPAAVDASPHASWDPVQVLQRHCTSALLLSRLYERFSARHIDALGEHGGVAARYLDLQRERLAEVLDVLGDKSRPWALGDEGLLRASGVATDASAIDEGDEGRDAWETQRKELLSHPIDVMGLLLRATLRPLNTMLHRWLTAGELADPYDEFFVVPSHGRTHSGFCLDTSPQRLPVFLSVAAACDLVHAGVSLRVLRAAATHAVLSAQKDARRLEGLAELHEAAAEEFAAELLDTQTLQSAIERFIERLVRGAPTAAAVAAMGQTAPHGGGAGGARGGEGGDTADAPAPLPLPPRVDVLSAYGAISWWRAHYQACTHVLLEAVEEAAHATDDDTDADHDGDSHHGVTNTRDATAAAAKSSSFSPWAQVDEEQVAADAAATAAAAGVADPPTLTPGDEEDASSGRATDASNTPLPATAAGGGTPTTAAAAAATSANEGSVTGARAPTAVLAVLDADAGGAAAAGPSSASEPAPYITVFMNSDDDEGPTAGATAGAAVDQDNGAASAPPSPTSSVPSAPASSSAATSVLGLRRLAGSRFSMGTTVTSSTASSRGTLALYGAITEELRQVSLLEQQTEAQLDKSRHALRAEFDTQLWRRRRAERLGEWRAERLALRLRRVRAMEALVEELRELHGIGSAGDAAAAASAARAEEDGATGQGTVVIPLRHLPPPRAAPPVILYAVADDELDGSGGTGAGGGGGPEGRRGSRTALTARSRRPSFAANLTFVEAATGSTAPTAPRRRSSAATTFLTEAAGVLPALLLPAVQRSHSASVSARRPGRRASAPNLSGPLAADWPRGTGSPPSPSARPAVRVPGPAAVTSVDSHTAPLLLAPTRAEGLTTICQLRDVAPGALTALGHNRAAAAQASRGAEAVASSPRKGAPPSLELAPSLPSSSLVPPQGCAGRAEEEAPAERANATAAATAARSSAGVVRRDALGYAHPDAIYRVADINDDEFLLERTGPRRYARREAEAAALARLEEGQAQLAACNVDSPRYVRDIAAAAAMASLGRGVPATAAPSTAAAESLQSARPAASRSPCETASADSRESSLLGAEEDAGTAAHARQRVYLSDPLAAAWQRDDPLWGDARGGAALGHDTEQDCTAALWRWSAAEAHRWYFDGDVTLPHRVLAGPAVDLALLVDVAINTEEADALQRVSGYYRALGQYTASFLTHKALQLTLLPPYGSLYRLTSQFLDVCLLQSAPVAVRLMDVWMTSVDVALEMMAEAEEAAMVQAVVRGGTELPTLAALTDARRGLNLADALAALNAAFQREWAACVPNGESTVKVEWRLVAPRGDGGAPEEDADGRYDADPTAEEESYGMGASLHDLDDDDTRGTTTASAAAHSPRHSSAAPSGGEEAAAMADRASPVQSFLAALRLTAVGPWCSGAWLLPDHTLRCSGALFSALLFWKSAERVVLNTWRAGMESGLSSVFFFCTTVRQVLLSSLQEALWGRLVELTAAYRESLRFEAGVLYSYRSLESFTIDHAAFLRECEFYTLCGPQFQRRVRPVLWAMMRVVEEAERSLRFAQVSVRVARRQYMATFHSMVSAGSSGSDSDDGDAAERVPGKAAAAATSPVPHPVTPSRWSRSAQRGGPSAAATAAASKQRHAAPSRPSPWYLRPLEDALAEHAAASSATSESDSAEVVTDPAGPPRPRRVGKRKKRKAATASPKASKGSAPLPSPPPPPQQQQRGTTRQRSASVVLTSSSVTTARSATPVSDVGVRYDRHSRGDAPSRDALHHSSPTHKKHGHRSETPAPGARLPTVAGTTEPHAASVPPLPMHAHKRSRSAGVTTRPLATSPPVSPVPARPATPHAAAPAAKRARRGGRRDRRLTSSERKERREKLRAIATRKVQEEVDHQRRLMRDMVSRQLRRFALLTQSLRDALAEVMIKADTAAMREREAAVAASGGDEASLKSMKAAQRAQQRHMDRYAYLSTMLRRLDALIDVMATQV